MIFPGWKNPRKNRNTYYCLALSGTVRFVYYGLLCFYLFLFLSDVLCDNVL